jgi:predicted nuclease of restriction endonuclease-like RecB superfamily
MLPSQLLRVRIRRGEIIPLLSTVENKSRHLEIAEVIINEFEESAANKEKRKNLSERISIIERAFEDYRFVRGLSTLLERRCQFSTTLSQQNENRENLTSPVYIRRLLWEESSRRGFALTDSSRDEILSAVASRTNVSPTSIMQSIWSDLDENMTLEMLDPISSEELLQWYDLSLLQTLFFTCTKLEFSVRGGTRWKNILRKVKHLGLMYNLNEQAIISDRPDTKNIVVGEGREHPLPSDVENNDDYDSKLVCSIDGPVSLFKLTDRYGTSIAKLIPFIIASSWWQLRAYITRKTMSGKKIYEFKASSEDFQHLSEPTRIYQNYNTNSSTFDSSLEERFATKFEHLANKWKIEREPDPLIIGKGVAFVPDFLFEKYGRKVYLEIVGFWTKDYLERKFLKVRNILHNSNVDLLVAVNEELSCSNLFNPSVNDLSKDRIIFFRKSSVPIKKVQEYLKSIDKQQIESKMLDSQLRIRFDNTNDVIPIEEISESYKVPIEIAVALATRDNDSNYLKIDSWFVSRSKMDTLAEHLKGTTKFNDVCNILDRNSIPEGCQAEIISILGYDVIWQSLDPDDAVLVKRK